MASNLKWYQQSIEDVFQNLAADITGLTSNEAQERLKKYGLNELPTLKSNVLKRLLRQFNNPMVYVLIVAAVITGILTLRGEHMLPDTAVILGVVILNVVLGFLVGRNPLVPVHCAWSCIVGREREAELVRIILVFPQHA